MTMDADDINADLLGPLLARWVRLVGLEHTLRIVRRHGGHPLYVPRMATPDHPMAQLVGFEAWCKLCSEHDGESVDVPKAQAALMDLRNRRMHAQRPNKTVRALAAEHRLCERRIKQILATDPADCAQPDQADLFRPREGASHG